MSFRLRPAADRAVPWLFAGALIAAILALYWVSLPFPFQFDDTDILVQNPRVQVGSLSPVDVLRALGNSFSSTVARPVSILTFQVNYLVGGLEPWGYRLVNILIHAACACLVFAFLRGALALAGTGRRWSCALFAVTLLWALNPIQSNAVVYVVQRETALATLFYLGGFLAYWRGRRLGGSGVPWLALSALLFVAAAGSKEIAWVFPFGLALSECAFQPGVRALLRRRPWVVAVFLAGGLALFPLALHHYGGVYDYFPFDWKQRVMTEWRVVAHYLGLLAFPHPSRLVLDYEVPLSTGLLSPPTTLIALSFHIGLLAVGAWALWARPLYGFALLGYYLHLVVESTVIPLDLAFEHRNYLPSIFLAVGLAGIAEEPSLRRLLRRGRGFAVLAAALGLAGVWAGWTWERLQAWKDPMTLWSDTLSKQPRNPRAHYGVGLGWAARGHYAQAEPHFREAVRLRPEFVDAEVALGVALWHLGRTPEAAACFLEVLNRKPDNAEAHANLAQMLTAVGDRQGALFHARKAEELSRR